MGCSFTHTQPCVILVTLPSVPTLAHSPHTLRSFSLPLGKSRIKMLMPSLHACSSFDRGASLSVAKTRHWDIAWGSCAGQTVGRPLEHSDVPCSSGRDMAAFPLWSTSPIAALSAGMDYFQTGQSQLVKPTWNELHRICFVPSLFI